MLHQIFNNYILSAMLLHQWRHISITIATTELSAVLLNPLAECRLDDVTLISIWRHSRYDDISMTSFVYEHAKLYAMLQQFFIDIRNHFSRRSRI